MYSRCVGVVHRDQFELTSLRMWCRSESFSFDWIDEVGCLASMALLQRDVVNAPRSKCVAGGHTSSWGHLVLHETGVETPYVCRQGGASTLGAGEPLASAASGVGHKCRAIYSRWSSSTRHPAAMHRRHSRNLWTEALLGERRWRTQRIRLTRRAHS